MRRVRYLSLPPLLLSLLLPISAFAAPWNEDKAFFTENLSFSSSKVDAADLNGDGYIDLVFANGLGTDKGEKNSSQPQQAYLNNAGAMMTDVSGDIFEGQTYNGRAVKLRDIDYDGDIDIVLGTTWETPSQLFINDGAGNFANETDTHLPPGQSASVGDIELGDVNGDGALDMLLTDWGTEAPVSISAGGVTQLWKQMAKDDNWGEPSTGMFEDVTLAQMPNVNVRWSWDAEFVDVDNDYDLDILVSAYAGDKLSVLLFANTDEKGSFKDVTAGNMAQGKNALDVEPMDLNGDSFLDLVTLHDGISGRNRVLINDTKGGFTDATGLVWPMLENPSSFDFMAAFYDYNSDAKVDVVLGAIQTVNKYPDRLMVNMAGKLKQWGADQIPPYQALQEVAPSSGTYAIVLADFNKDNRLDLAMAQNENNTEKKIFLATEEIPVDIAPPIFVNYEKLGQLTFPSTEVLRVRCHDNKSPLMLHDFTQNDGLPYLEYWTAAPDPDPELDPGTKSDPGQWYGEYLWRISFDVPDADAFFYRICAIDAAGNKACTPVLETEVTGGTETESDTMSSATDTETDSDTTMGASATVSESDSTVSDSMTDPTVGTASMTEPTESNSMSNSESDSTPTETFGTVSESDSLTVTATASESESDSVSDSSNVSAGALDDDGCGCNTNGSPVQGVLSSLALLGLLGLRRRRSV